MRRCRDLADILLPVLREVARQGGWALTTHGSMERDIDVVLIPWREVRPISVEGVMARIFAVCDAVVHAEWVGGKEKGSVPPPEQKPHGRMAWSITFGGGPYLDVSAMPLPPEPEAKP
jgi:hypothetical protein